MSGRLPPLAHASSRAAPIWTGLLSSPNSCVVALPGIELCRLLGDWVAKSRPRPYLRACEASRLVDSLHAVVPDDGTRSCASFITSRALSGSPSAGLRLIQENRAIWSWLTKPC